MEEYLFKTLLIPASALIVLFLPGYALLVWFPRKDKDPIQILAEVLGLSLALTSLAGLAAFIVNLHLSGYHIGALYLLAALLAAWGQVRRRPSFSLSLQQLFILGAFFLVILWRFYQIRDLVLPAWVDSPHHVLIVRKIMETGGVPADLSPYLPIPFYYHFGFHLAAALFAFWGRFSPAEAVLILGQILNAAIFLSVYRLGLTLWGDQGRSLLAALLVGFVSQMPAYYAAWGRYPLITGLVLLPLVIARALEIKQAEIEKPQIIVLSLLMGGLILSHYLTAFLFLIFFGLLFLSLLYEGNRTSLQKGLVLMAGVFGGLLLTSPWIYRVWSKAGIFVHLKTNWPGQPLNQLYFEDYGSYLLYLLGPVRNYCLVVLAGLGLLQIFKDRHQRIFGLWTLLLGLGALPWGARLAPFRPDHLTIVLFLPLCLLAAQALVTLADRLKSLRWSPWARPIGLLFLGALFCWGLWETESIIKPETVLADQADLQALRWIEKNIAPEARFLINGTPWAWGIYRGVDGGMWIQPLTGRWTILPPIFYGFGGRAYASKINQLAARVSRITGCTTAFWDLVRETHLTHIYLKSGRGSLIPEAFRSCPGIELVYNHNGIFIFSLL